MNIYKLQYDTKAEGDADLLAKGTYEVVTEEGVTQDVYTNGTQAIVYIGKIVEIPATYDDEGHEITPPVYYDGVSRRRGSERSTGRMGLYDLCRSLILYSTSYHGSR